MKKNFDKLALKLKYQFKDVKLLRMALSHRSANVENYERLEFLGDSVLDLIIAEALYKHYPFLPEGILSRYRSRLVCEASLVALAKQFELGDYLVLGPGELKSGGARRESILADSMEAIMGAIYIDSDFDTVKTLILTWYHDILHSVHSEDEGKDPKTTLQEYLQSKKIPLPRYYMLNVEGDLHDQSFYVRCEVAELNLVAEGTGASRRRAEQSAAKQILELIEAKSK